MSRPTPSRASGTTGVPVGWAEPAGTPVGSCVLTPATPSPPELAAAIELGPTAALARATVATPLPPAAGSTLISSARIKVWSGTTAVA